METTRTSLALADLLGPDAADLYVRAKAFADASVSGRDILWARDCMAEGDEDLHRLRQQPPVPPDQALGKHVLRRFEETGQPLNAEELTAAALCAADVEPYGAFSGFLHDLTRVLRQRYEAGLDYMCGKLDTDDLLDNLIEAKKSQKIVGERRRYSAWTEHDPLARTVHEHGLGVLGAQIVASLFAHEVYGVFPNLYGPPCVRDLLLAFAVDDPRGYVHVTATANELIEKGLCETEKGHVARLYQHLVLTDSCSESLYSGLAAAHGSASAEAALSRHLEAELLDADSVFVGQ